MLSSFFQFLAPATVCSLYLSIVFPVQSAEGPKINRDPWGGWLVEGELTGNYEYYQVSGDTTQSPYPFIGHFGYGEFDLFLQKRFSRYESVNARAFGVYNHSNYRSPLLDEFLLERASLNWTKGNAAVPFRFDAGDYFGNISLSTLQRSLKGVQLELQPVLVNPDLDASLVLFAGIGDPIYRSINYGEEIFSGASFLVSSRRRGDLSLNFVNSYREADSVTGLPVLNQWVASAGYEKNWRVGQQALNFEIEGSYFIGDYGSSLATLNSDTHDTGIHARLSGRSLSKPLTYSIMYERYGEDFQPRGGAVGANRETIEARSTYRLKSGLQARARAQRFVDGLESSNPTTTYVGGLDFVGPFAFLDFWESGVTGNVSSFVSDVQNKSGASHNITWSNNSFFSTQLNQYWGLNWGGSYTLVDNRIADTKNRFSSASVGLDWNKAINDWQVRIAPRFSIIHSLGSNFEVVQYNPSIAVDLANGSHRFGLDYGLFYQDSLEGSSLDTIRHNASLRYTYSRGDNTFGITGSYIGRDTIPGTETHGYKIAAYFTRRFSNQKSVEDIGPIAQIDFEDQNDIRLAAIGPGTLLSDALALLKSAGIQNGVQRGSALVFEVIWFDDIDARQRLVMVHDGRTISKTAILISFPDIGNTSAAESHYIDVRDNIIRRYGTPSTFDEGSFQTEFPAGILTDRLIRTASWRLGNGSLRLGIPNRLDRQIQIEIHYGSGFESPRKTRWGLDQVR